eukprot:6755463-Pyramimonas_sp.AAC.1
MAKGARGHQRSSTHVSSLLRAIPGGSKSRCRNIVLLPSAERRDRTTDDAAVTGAVNEGTCGAHCESSRRQMCSRTPRPVKHTSLGQSTLNFATAWLGAQGGARLWWERLRL